MPATSSANTTATPSHPACLVPAAAPSDEVLLTLARAGDHAAFRTLVERYQAAVASTVTGMLGRGADADDVGQETFVRFHDALAQYRGEASLGTYLRRIAMNLSLNALKRRRRGLLRFVSRDHVESRPAEPPMAPFDMVQAERVDVVRRAVATLAEKHRAVVVLRMLDGLSTLESAAVLGVPPGTIMSRLSRGMAELKLLLTPYYVDDRGGSNA